VNGTRELDTPTRLLAGAMAGITSVSTTYPLDLVRARLSIASATFLPPPTSSATSSALPSSLKFSAAFHTAAQPRKPPGIIDTALKIIREEGGLRALYRGLVPTAVGVAPYVGLNFSSYELLRQHITPPGKENVGRKLSCGALAGTISQTLTYPFDVLRRKMQTTNMSGGALGYKYNGSVDALISIAKTEGLPGLYRGLWPNLRTSRLLQHSEVSLN
jgi:solute carrier family 25 phosphate transporter 23/24/25/41